MLLVVMDKQAGVESAVCAVVIYGYVGKGHKTASAQMFYG